MLDFYLFCLKRRHVLVKYIFVMLFNLLRYKLCLISENQFVFLAKKYASSAIKICPDAQELALEFWETHKNKLGEWYNAVKKDDDVVVSASFGFLLKPAMEILGIKNAVSSEIDLKSGDITRICFGKYKIDCFRKIFGGAVVNDFYTDSMNDKAFMLLAQNNVYLVNNGKARLFDKSKLKEGK